jgi:diguanylate cyclase
VLAANRNDEQRLQQRLLQLLANWESNSPDAVADPDAEAAAEAAPAGRPSAFADLVTASQAESAVTSAAAEPDPSIAVAWHQVVSRLGATASIGLPPRDPRGQAVSAALADLTARMAEKPPSPTVLAFIDKVCSRADLLAQQRHDMVDQLDQLCRELTAGIADLAEDDSWAQGQARAMQARLDEGMNARGVRSVTQLLADTRTRQLGIRDERNQARDVLKSMIQTMLSDLGSLGNETGRFQGSLERYATTIEEADSLESLAGVVQDLVQESRTVSSLVAHTRDHLMSEHAKATELDERVQGLEAELRRLSDEVATDQLTQVANRRGLMAAFEVERARSEREGHPLSLALIDVDDFKRLNDKLGHAAGDRALASLAAAVQKALRPTDLVARYGGEEFVILLPTSNAEEAEQIVSRLQRSLTSALFMHEANPVFVTFSAGVTLHITGERIEASLDRADEAMYQAKRTGKNRTCVA